MENKILSQDELEQVTGGHYDGPIPYDQIEEKGKQLDWIRETYGLEDAVCVASRYYWDDTATEIFRTQGGASWAQYVLTHYDPNCGMDRT